MARIRELQTLLGLNLDEIAIVLRNEDRMAQIRLTYHDKRTSDEERRRLTRECLDLQEDLRATVEAKRVALEGSWPTSMPGSGGPATCWPVTGLRNEVAAPAPAPVRRPRWRPAQSWPQVSRRRSGRRRGPWSAPPGSAVGIRPKTWLFSSVRARDSSVGGNVLVPQRPEHLGRQL
ncbi:MAG: hypothetical protein ABJB47_13990 [Actinomycetota bacterium]